MKRARARARLESSELRRARTKPKPRKVKVMTKENAFSIVPFDAAEYLKDEETIAEFLNASVEMNDPAVLLNALTTVIRAHSMSRLAELSGLGRESLYKALKPGAQPRYETVMRLISALGVRLEFKAPSAPRRTASATHAAKPPRVAPVRKNPVETRAVANGEKRAPRAKKA